MPEGHIGCAEMECRTGFLKVRPFLTVAYGYKWWHVAPVSFGVRSHVVRMLSPSEAVGRPVMESLGCHVEGIVPPVPDVFSPSTTYHGCLARLLRDTPKPRHRLLMGLRSFVRWFLKKFMTPLGTPKTDSLFLKDLPHGAGFKHWVETRQSFSRRKKNHLFDYWMSKNWSRLLATKSGRVKAFAKLETYPGLKPQRVIRGRTDAYKCWVGPVIAAIEEVLYKLPFFIKHVPVDQRAKYICEHLSGPGRWFCETDFTCFEGTITKLMMDVCEMELVRYMTSLMPQLREWFICFKKITTGKIHSCFRSFEFIGDASRCSGDMHTSLGNGWTNLMVMLYYMDSVWGIPPDKAAFVVEGDDGLSAWPSDMKPDTQIHEGLGLILKMIPHKEISDAGFCGMVLNPDTLTMLSDPYKRLATFGTHLARTYGLSRKLRLSLLRAKALSFGWMYQRCPVITSLAKYGLRVTEGSGVNPWLALRSSPDKYWLAEIYAESFKFGVAQIIEGMTVDESSRCIVERKFGMSVTQQLMVESYLDKLNDIDRKSVV